MRIKALKKNHSARLSKRFSKRSLPVRIDRKDKIQLPIKNIAANPVNSSIKVLSLHVLTLIEVVTTKQNPNRLDAVPKICCEVLFAI